MNVIIDYFKQGEFKPTYTTAVASDELLEGGGCLGRTITYIDERGKGVAIFRMGGYITSETIDDEIAELEKKLNFLKSNQDWVKGK